MENQAKINKDIQLEGVNSFEQTSLSSFLVQCLLKCGFTRPTPIQYYTIDAFEKYPEHNIAAQSKSGTGKTLAFLTPILNSLCLRTETIKSETLCLIILPTRELSIQVHQYLKQIINASAEIKALPEEKQCKSILKGLSSLLTIGGIPIEDDKKTLMTSGANFVVGTVGKIYQLIESGSLKTHSLQYVIFDQGDKLFASKDEKLDRILVRIKNAQTKKAQQLRNEAEEIKQKPQDNKHKVRYLVFSATYDQQSIVKITQKLTQSKGKGLDKVSEPLRDKSKFLYIQTLTNSHTNQFIEKVTENVQELSFVTFADKSYNKNTEHTLKDKIKNEFSQIKVQGTHSQSTDLINLQNIRKFCHTVEDNRSMSLIARKCGTLAKIFEELEFQKCLVFVQKKALLQQIEGHLKRFEPLVIHGSLSQANRIKALNQATKSKIIVCSDLLARGIDLKLDLVVLYDAKLDETFWHRIGRTGRFGRMGVVVTLDRIEGWKQYEKEQINEILRTSQIASCPQVPQLKKPSIYGTYMTEYGQWHQVDQQKEQIFNQNYNFYEENQQKLYEPQHLTKKLKKEMKRIQKKVERSLHQTDQIRQMYEPKMQEVGMEEEIRTSFGSRAEFQEYFKEIFNCGHCFKLIREIKEVTNQEFEVEAFFNQSMRTQNDIGLI